MKSDEGFSDMLNKTILIDYLNENVTPSYSNKNSKRAVFTALFFYLHQNNSDEEVMKV